MGIIQLAVPEGFEADEVTITLRRIPTAEITQPIQGSKTLLLRGGPAGEISGSKHRPIKSKRNDLWKPEELAYLMANWGKLPGQAIASHLGRTVAACNWQHHTRKNKPAPKQQGSRWTEEEISRLIELHGSIPDAALASKLGKTPKQMQDKWCYLKASGKVKTSQELNQEAGWKLENQAQCPHCFKSLYGPELLNHNCEEGKAAEAAAEAAAQAMQDEGTLSALYNTEPSVLDQARNIFKRTPDLPPDFNPAQKFGVGCYVWHSPSKEIGRVVEITPVQCQVDFKGHVKRFTPDGCRSMYAQMLLKFPKDEDA